MINRILSAIGDPVSAIYAFFFVWLVANVAQVLGFEVRVSP